MTHVYKWARFRAAINGAQVVEVVEPVGIDVGVVVFEFEEYPEPKVLRAGELKALCKRYGRLQTVADLIGASEAFVRQNVR